jgi:hypothetical protein
MRLIRLTVSLATIFTALIGVSCGVGRASAPPNPLRDLGFDRCGEKACFMGITPGITSWDALRARFPNANVIQDSLLPDRFLSVRVNGGMLYMQRTITDTPIKLELIEIDIRNPITLGDLVALYDHPLSVRLSPCGIEILCSSGVGYPTLVYKEMLIILDGIGVPIARITPQTQIREIAIVDTSICTIVPEQSLPRCFVDYAKPVYFDWTGFASLCHLIQLRVDTIKENLRRCDI